MSRSRTAIRLELIKVRERLKVARSKGDTDEMLYGAQQALGWVLGELSSPSELEEFCEQAAIEEHLGAGA